MKYLMHKKRVLIITEIIKKKGNVDKLKYFHEENLLK